MTLIEEIFGKLTPGKYSAGFNNYFITDSDRILYDNYPRPVLFNIWYPAIDDKFKDFLKADSFRILPFSNQIQKEVADKYIDYSRISLTNYLNDSEGNGTYSEPETECFNKYTARISRTKRGILPAAGKFPVIIYHMGLGSTYDDNYIMCEYLASHGYVVINSLYYKSWDHFAPGDKNQSLADIKILISEASKYEFTDTANISVMGHSFGAQAGYLLICENFQGVKSIVALDPTFDKFSYEEIINIWGKDYIEYLCNAGIKPRQQILHLAPVFKGKKPLYIIPNKFENCERYITTVNHEILHDGFISLGVFTAYNLLVKGINSFNHDKTIELFPEICKLIRYFLDYTLTDSFDLPGRLNSLFPESDFEIEHIAPKFKKILFS